MSDGVAGALAPRVEVIGVRSAWVAVVGSANIDIVVPVPHLPAPSETVLGGDHAQLPGGKGANQAVALARLERAVSFIGRVGRDEFGSRLRGHLQSEGVDIRWLRDDEAPTGLAIICVANDGENQIAVSSGANARLSHRDIEDSEVAGASAVLCQLEVPLEAVVAAAERATGTFVLNPAPAQPLPASLLGHVDVLVPNRIELQALTRADSSPKSLDAVAHLASQLDVPATVVTLGKDGALCVEGGSVTHVAAPQVQPVDTTGAGDAFCAGLVDALVEGADLVAAARFATRVAAAAVTGAGAQSSLPTRQDPQLQD